MVFLPSAFAQSILSPRNPLCPPLAQQVHIVPAVEILIKYDSLLKPFLKPLLPQTELTSLSSGPPTVLMGSALFPGFCLVDLCICHKTVQVSCTNSVRI